MDEAGQRSVRGRGTDPGADPGAGASAEPEPRQAGTVKWFDEVRGFGFLGRDGAVDVFVHASAVEGEALRPGERVTFEVGEGARGLQARAVQREG